MPYMALFNRFEKKLNTKLFFLKTEYANIFNIMFFICDKYMGLIGVAVHELFVFRLLSPYGDNREGRESVKEHIWNHRQISKSLNSKNLSRHGNMLGREPKSSGEEFRIHSSPELFNPPSQHPQVKNSRLPNRTVYIT